MYIRIMSIILDITNDTSTKITCPINSTIKLTNISSSSDKCNEKALKAEFKRECSGKNGCEISKESLACNENINVKYDCIDSKGKVISTSSAQANINKEAGGDLIIDAVINTTTTGGDMQNNNTNSVQSSIDGLNEDSNSVTNNTSSNDNSSSSSSHTSNNPNTKSTMGFLRKYKLVICCCILLLIILLGYLIISSFSENTNVVDTEIKSSDVQSDITDIESVNVADKANITKIEEDIGTVIDL
jgi:hypothetical protein